MFFVPFLLRLSFNVQTLAYFEIARYCTKGRLCLDHLDDLITKIVMPSNIISGYDASHSPFDT